MDADDPGSPAQSSVLSAPPSPDSQQPETAPQLGKRRRTTILPADALIGIDDESETDDDVSEDENDSQTSKKIKTSRQTTAGGKVKGKGKGKGKIGKGKKKEKGKAVEIESDEEVKPFKKPKKVLLAKEAKWKDLPDWGDRIDSPILELPDHILDKCFGYQPGLEMRDYVALAGVNKYFRHHLDDKFFKDLVDNSGYSVSFRHVDGRPIPYRYKSEYKREKDVQHNAAYRPFSRAVPDWRVDPKPGKHHDIPKISHYVPRGERSAWSRAQYIVYKEEKDLCRDQLWFNWEKEHNKEHRDFEETYLHGTHKTVLAWVTGRSEGEATANKDEEGMPLGNDRKHGMITTKVSPMKLPAAIESHATELVKRAKREMLLPSDRDWTVPDSEDEHEGLPFNIRFDHKHDLLKHDFWPSQYRSALSFIVNMDRITKTASFLCRTFFVIADGHRRL